MQQNSQIIKEWGVCIDEEKDYGYPSIDNLKGLQDDLNQYYDLFIVVQNANNYYIGGIPLKNFNSSHVAQSISNIMYNSYFKGIREY